MKGCYRLLLGARGAFRGYGPGLRVAVGRPALRPAAFPSHQLGARLRSGCAGHPGQSDGVPPANGQLISHRRRLAPASRPRRPPKASLSLPDRVPSVPAGPRGRGCRPRARNPAELCAPECGLATLARTETAADQRSALRDGPALMARSHRPAPRHRRPDHPPAPGARRPAPGPRRPAPGPLSLRPHSARGYWEVGVPSILEPGSAERRRNR